MATPEEEDNSIYCPEVETIKEGSRSKGTSSNEENEINTTLKEMSTDEKDHKTKPEVFKKPVYLVGPRRGKAAGKMQILKSIDYPGAVIEPNGISEVLTIDKDKIAIKASIEAINTEAENDAVINTETINTEAENDVVDGKKVHKILPAQKLNESVVPFPYKEPKWSGIPTELYKFEVLKNGSILETIDLSSKPFFVFGRLTTCDIHMAHPTVSRFHAVLQFRGDNADGQVGFYIYDLGSTHGTFLNKYRIKPNMYVRVYVGHLLKLGGSSRMFILQGPKEDMEKESELSLTELKERKKERIAKDLQEIQEHEQLRLLQEKEAVDGIDWGMGDDADEETDLSENPFAAAPNEELYLDDPKKTLRGWFEREGYDLEYDVEEKGFGQYLCRVELPVESAKGGTVVAESLVKGKKKESVVQCALEACRILDRYGLLRQAKHESRKRKVKNWEENDYYDSDEDEFLDRTGTVAKKRQQRMQAAGKIQTQTETYESLVKKHEDILYQINQIQNQLDNIHKGNNEEPEVAEDEDALDAFMTNLSKEVPDIKLINKLKSEILSLRKEEAHVRKLVNIACPASLPKLKEDAMTLPSSLLRNKLAAGPRQKMPSQLLLSESTKVRLNRPRKDIDPKGEVVEDEKEEEDEEENENVGQEVVNRDSTVTKEHAIVADETNAFHTEEHEMRDHVENVIYENLVTHKETDNSNPSLIKEVACNLPEDSCGHTLENSTVKSMKVIGPRPPPEDFIPEEHMKKFKKRTRQRQNKKIIKESDSPSSSDPNYSMWVPPENQSGDGRTKLNEKYGY